MKHKSFFRLMALFLGILLPIALIGSFFINRSLQLQDDLVASTMTQRFSEAVHALDSQMDSLQSSLLYLLQERELTLLSSRPDSMSDFDRAMSISSIQRRLYTLHMSYPNLYMLSLCVPELGLQLNSISYGSGATIQRISDGDALAFFEQGRKAGNGFTYSTENGLSCYLQVPGLPSYSKQTAPRLMLRVDYDTEAILQALSQPLSDAQVSLMVSDAEGRLLGSANVSGESRAPLSAIANGDENVCFHRFSGQTWYTQQFRLEHPEVVLTFAVSRQEALGETLQMRLWLIVFFLLLALAVTVYTFYTYSHIQKPIDLLMDGFARLESGDMQFQLDYRRRNEFSRLITRFNHMLGQLRSLIAQLYDQKILTQQSEMKHLQAQINPHFLYNSFYLLNNMILMQDCEAAGELSRHLGAYFKYVTHTDQQYVRLSEELDQARVYLSIQKIRFQDGVRIDFPPPPEGMSNPAMPRLILQPLLENIFKHAFHHFSDTKEIRISYREDEALVYVTVENSGPLLSPEELDRIRQAARASQEDSTGLANVHRRLVISHGTGLHITAREEGGLSVCVSLKRNITENDLSAGHLR